jgi:hypothetical protein
MVYVGLLNLPIILSVTCADFRSVPEFFFQLEADGLYLLSELIIMSHLFILSAVDRVIVARIPGGLLNPIPQGILAVDTFFGFKDILVIHHTGEWAGS